MAFAMIAGAEFLIDPGPRSIAAASASDVKFDTGLEPETPGRIR
jgi:hypothetical protein